jgi:GMP reductase
MANAVGAHRMPGCLHKLYDLDVLTEHYGTSSNGMTFLSVGLDAASQEKLKIIKQKFGMVSIPICLDVANGYTEKFENYLKYLRLEYPQAIIMAGNVVTPEMTEQLLLSGADIVKVGIGPGSVCTTRLATGVGYPQFSAIAECKDAAHGLGGLICSDGGCRTPGDVCKAFGAGADFVMLGGMFAGTDECDGEWIHEYEDKKWSSPDGLGGGSVEYFDKGKKKYLKFYGMSSKEAQEKYNGGQQPYRAAEGKSVTVPYKGPVDNVVQEILGGLRSACAYVGARRLKDFDKCCSFVRVNNTHNKVYE